MNAAEVLACRRCQVSGRVQGVGFRASARREAQRLGLSGYAANLADGRVDVLACGQAAQIDAFCAWLARGPAHAAVESVSCQPVDVPAPVGFVVR